MVRWKTVENGKRERYSRRDYIALRVCIKLQIIFSNMVLVYAVDNVCESHGAQIRY